MIITKEGYAVSEMDFGLSKLVEQHGRLDIQSDYLAKFIKYIPNGGTVLDIGACLGDHTLTYVRFVGPSGRVIAIEPNPESFLCLKHNMALETNCTLYNWAVGSKFGQVGMVKEAGPHNLGGSRVSGPGDIMMMVLDDVLILDRLDFVKIDIEGCEQDALEGMVRLIRRFKPVILIEIARHILAANGRSSDGLIGFIQGLGYSVQPSEASHSFDMDIVDALCIPN